jgi:hypothetical protein
LEFLLVGCRSDWNGELQSVRVQDCTTAQRQKQGSANPRWTTLPKVAPDCSLSRGCIAGPLPRDVDRNCDVGIPVIKQVIAFVDIRDIDIVSVIPVVRPVPWPRVNEAYPVAFVLESWISANNEERKSLDAEAVVRPEESAETFVRNAITVVAATLLPGAVVGLPVCRAMLLPGGLLDTMLSLGALWLSTLCVL